MSAYKRAYDSFRWELPSRFNMGVAVSDKWALKAPDRPAILEYGPDGSRATLTYAELSRRSNALANALRAKGVQRGDRVALLLPQGFEVLISHVAIYKLGAIAVPLALLFGVEALEYRLYSSGAKAIIASGSGLAKIGSISPRLPELKLVVSVEGASGKAVGFDQLLAQASGAFEPEDTGPDDPALMIFTSGTTGPPKGALHGHRVLLGHMPGVGMAYEFPPRPDDVMWTPADWAWAGGLLNALLPALYLGVPVVSARFEKFSADAAVALLEEMRVTCAFIPPTALRMLRTEWDSIDRRSLTLRTICSAGESLGRETLEWAQSALGASVNEFYGQTECNLVLGSSAALGVAKAGAIGRPVPGHRVRLIDGQGRPVPKGTPGQIAIHRPDPVMFLGYWENEAATERKFIGEWMTTGDLAVMDEDGYFQFFGRDDDVITSAGFRIGPSEIEDCLSGHPAVSLAAAVGKPDALRTEIVKAYIVLKDGVTPSETLEEDIKVWVRSRLSAHEYPREVEFVGSMPLTTTGKVIRRIFRDRARTEAAG
ncbi:MAG: AMP-binding protein [Rhizobiaceae bacterium]